MGNGSLGPFLLVGSLGGDFGCEWTVAFGFVEFFVEELEFFGGVCEVFLVYGHGVLLYVKTPLCGGACVVWG